MKPITLSFILLFCLLLVGCGVEGETATATSTALSTAVPTHVAVAANTAVPPTATQPPATGTAVPPTNTATLTLTNTPAPTLTATPQPTTTSTNTPIPLPPPTGKIYFLWDPAPLSDGGQISAEPRQSVYSAIPGSSPDNWQIEPILNDLYGWPSVALSPDQTKLAIGVLEDVNQDGSISATGAAMGFDLPNLFIYSLVDGSYTRVTEDFPDTLSLHWTPDSQTVTYRQNGDIFSVNLADSTRQELPIDLPANASRLTWSPDGRFLAFSLQFGDMLHFYDVMTGEVTTLDGIEIGSSSSMIWSPDSQSLTVTTIPDGPVVVDPLTREVIKPLASSAPGTAAWSSDSQLLMLTQATRDPLGNPTAASLFMWDAQSNLTELIVEKQSISQPVWRSNDRVLATGYLDEGMGGLLLIDTESGSVETLAQWDDVFLIAPMSWSPDGNWLLFLKQTSDQTGLYLINPQAPEQVYTLLDVTNTIYPNNIFWLP